MYLFDDIDFVQTESLPLKNDIIPFAGFE